MTTRTRLHTSPSSLGRSKRPTSLVSRVMQLLTISRERHALKDMDEHILKDIGISRTAAEQEANRPAWDAPNRWMR